MVTAEKYIHMTKPPYIGMVSGEPTLSSENQLGQYQLIWPRRRLRKASRKKSIKHEIALHAIALKVGYY